jgi:aminobenzoyl-glutamate utilization protein B
MRNVLDTPEKAFALEFAERNFQATARLSDALFYFGELGLQEYRSAELMGALLEEHGFRLQRGVSGFPTAFLGSFGRGTPVIAIHAEYDANPTNSQQSGVPQRAEIVPNGPGHCEGHNVNGAVMTVAAIGLRYIIERFNLPGTLKIFGAPAEEQLLSRPYFVRDGLFDDVDVAFHAHILDEFKADYGVIQSAAVSADFTFHGESSHAAMFPFKARDALDAAVLMDAGMAQYREHLQPGMSAHRVFTEGGSQPNVIPSRAAVWWYFRHATAEGAQLLFSQAQKIAQGAALMTNCELDVNVRSAVWPVRLSQSMAEAIQHNIEAIGMPSWTAQEQSFAKALQGEAAVPICGLRASVTRITGPTLQSPASNDCGDISWKVPMARVWFPSNVPNLAFHHWSAGAALATSIAHKGAVAGIKALMTSAIDHFQKPDLLTRTKENFRREIGDIVYKPLLPNGQRPPSDLNRIEMEKYRKQMERFYVRERPEIKP